MRDNPEGEELDAADNVRRRCKETSLSVLSCIVRRTRESCDHGSKVRTVHSGRDGEEPIPLKKPKESGRRESCEKDFVSSPFVYYANVSPLHRGGAVSAPLSSGGPKWRGNFPEWSEHAVTTNRFEPSYIAYRTKTNL